MGAPKGGTGATFNFRGQLGDPEYVIQDVTVSGSFSGQNCKGPVQVSFQYSWTEVWAITKKTVKDQHQNSPGGVVAKIGQFCSTKGLYENPWTFSSNATFTLWTGSVKQKTASRVTPVKDAKTTVICDDKTKELTGMQAIINMYPGDGSKGKPAPLDFTKLGGSASCTDTWDYHNNIPKKDPKYWEGSYNSGGYNPGEIPPVKQIRPWVY
jgi:hypothetical protein